MFRMCVVTITKFAEKRLKKLPKPILEAYYNWVRAVEYEGIQSMRKLPGYHDEPLKAKRAGQRSVRLSRSYRVIYEVKQGEEVEIIGVMEVSKHDY